MHSRTIQLSLLPICLAIAFAGPSQAIAQPILGDSKIEFKLKLPDGESFKETTLESPLVKDYFNYAYCGCDKSFQVKLSAVPFPDNPADENVDIWVGGTCDSAPENVNDTRNVQCQKIEANINSINGLRSQPSVTIGFKALMAPNKDSCLDAPSQDGSQNVYALVDTGQDGIDGDDYATQPFAIPFDMKAPPQVTEIVVKGAEEAIGISWTLPENQQDIFKYQVLCARTNDGTPNTETATHAPAYRTPLSLCGSDQETDKTRNHPIPGDIKADESSDAALAIAADLEDNETFKKLWDLDDAFICGETTAGESIRVENLENDVSYQLVLVVVDEYGNGTALDIGSATPAPVIDGWEHYRGLGGNADGEYCFVATATYGNYDHPFVRILRDFRDDTLKHHAWGRSFIAWYYANSPGLAAFIVDHPAARVVSYFLLAPLVAAAAIWEYTGILGKLALLVILTGLVMWRKRRRQQRPEQSRPTSKKRRFALALATAVVLVGGAATAHAQPYWDDLEEPEVSHSVSGPKWTFEFKLGPYFPNIDDEFAAGIHPFEDIFGPSSNLMTVLGLDRYFLTDFGQLGLTATIGYNKQKANALAQGPDGKPIVDGDKYLRSEGDLTTFRLIPTSLGVVYRFTYLDDAFGIPIVPYGKASLSYYMYRWLAPNGELSQVACPPDNSDCGNSSASGASLGYQATAGISVRAERLDPRAEINLRNELDIYHVGFFAEVMLAKVDGFGSDTKLKLGDTTWFAGINFEF